MKYILTNIKEHDRLNCYWREKLKALLFTTFTHDGCVSYISDVTGVDYPDCWLLMQPELDYLIEQRGDLSERIDILNSQRYYEEVKNDVMNLDDRYKAQLGEWLNEHLDIEVAKDNEWNNDN